MRRTIGEFLAVSGIALLSILIRIGYFVEPPNIDQSICTTIAREMVSGKILYTEIWTHHCPLTYYINAAVFYCTGGSLWFFHLLEVGNTLIAGILLYYVLKLWIGKNAGLFAFFSYGILFNNVLLGGWYSRAEDEILFEIPVLGIFLLAYYIQEKHKKENIFCAIQGILWVALLLIKLSIIPFFLCICADYPDFQDRRKWYKFWKRLSYFAIGVLSAILAFVLFFWYTDRLAVFWDCLFSYNYHYQKSAFWDSERQLSAISRLVSFFSVYYYLTPVAVLSVYGYVQILFHARKSYGILLWPWASLAQVVWQNKFWYYHFIPFLSPLIVMFAIGMFFLLQKMKVKERIIAIGGIVSIAIMLIPFLQVWWDYHKDHRIFDYMAGRISREMFLEEYRWKEHAVDSLSLWDAGNYIKASSKPDDTLFLFGMNSAVYLYSGLPCATRFPLFPYMPTSSYYRSLMQKLWEELDRGNPKFLVVSKDMESFYGLWKRHPDDPVISKFVTMITERYNLVKVYGNTIYVYQRK